MLGRRHLLHLTAGLAAGAVLSPVQAAGAGRGRQAEPDRPAPPASAREARLIWARLVGDLSGKPVFFFTHGSVWGFKPQSDDLALEDFARRLYGYSGVAARRMKRQRNGDIMIDQKLWAFYRDPVSDEISDRIHNPYTEKVDTASPLSGPMTSRALDLNPPADGRMPYEMRIRRLGGTAVVETSAFARFKPANIDWYKLEGNLEDYVCHVTDLDSKGATHLPSRYSQNVIAEWQTWTGMHGTPGHILFKGNGEPLRAIEQVPSDQIAAIERHFAGTLDDVRAW